jgi:hypothetical protein
MTNQTTTHKFTGHLAVHWLEKLEATYNGGDSFTVHYWDYDANTCNHYDITRNKFGDIEIPAELMDLHNHPKHIARRNKNAELAQRRSQRK